MAMQEKERAIDIVLDYHQQTKHQINRSARSLGYMDWENQPNPFRHYQGTSTLALEYVEDHFGPLYHELYGRTTSPQKVSHDTISQLFYYSMALSAWKQVPGSASWPLRVNPSSGNLHPTESYLIIGSQAAPQIHSGLYHYASSRHFLEQRRCFTPDLWHLIEKQIPKGGFLVGLSSIYWRETWKYGERGFRYCHHDVGHAMGAVTMAAILLGWQAALLDSMTDEDASILLGCDTQNGVEAEHADCLMVINPEPLQSKQDKQKRMTFLIDQDFMKALKGTPFIGKENQLSSNHHEWPIIDEVSSASRKMEETADGDRPIIASLKNEKKSEQLLFPKSDKTAAQIIRQRRSAVAMDGATSLDQFVFYGMLRRLQPDEGTGPFACLPWTPKVSLVFFAHRVRQLDPGLYVLVRDADHLKPLKKTMATDFLWEKPSSCPEDLRLYLLMPQDMRRVAKTISCAQDIAADGCFSLGMLAHFEPIIRNKGAHLYSRLFWETGLIGQILYLEAEAAGIQGTGIGCFLDDVMHEVLGIQDQSWQSLYHFTVGGSLVDDRLKTLPAYHHLQSE